MNIATIINLSITGLILLIIAFSVIYGLIVGFKESVANGIYNLILVILLLFLTGIFAKNIIDYDLTTLGFSLDGAKTISEFIINTLQNVEGIEDLMSEPEMVDLVTKLPLMIATPIIFTTVFWTIKLIVWIVTLICKLIYFIFIRPFVKNAKDLKQENKKITINKIKQANTNLENQLNISQNLPERKIKKSKRRGLGALIGLFIGLITVFATFVPVFGIGSILTQLNSYNVDSNGNIINNTLCLNAENNSEEGTPLLVYLTQNESIVDIIDAYNNATGIKIVRVVGLEKLGEITFNSLSSTNVNGTNVKLVDEISNTLIIYKDYNDIATLFSKTSLTQEEMTTLINKLDRIVNDTFNSNFIKAVGNTIVPKVLDKMLNDPDFAFKLPEQITKDEIKNEITTAVINNIKEEQVQVLKTTLLDLINILKVCDNNQLLTPIYNKTMANEELTASFFMNLLQTTNSSFSKDLANAITEIDLIENISPTLVNTGLKALFKELNTVYPCEEFNYNNQTVTKEKSIELISTCLKEIIEIAKTIDIESKYYATKDSFIPVGDLLDYIKQSDIITTNQYNKIIDFAQEKLTDLSSSLPIDTSKIISNLDNLTDWSKKENKKDFTKELTKYGEIFEDSISIFDTINTENINIEKIDFNKLGKVFDKLENTTLVNNAVISIFNDGLDYIKDQKSDLASVIEELKIDDTKTVNWEKELTALKPLIISAKNINLSIENVSDAISILDILDDVEAVEKNEDAPIFGSKMVKVLKAALQYAKTQVNENEMVTSICENILNQIDAREENETLKNCGLKGILSYAKTLIPSASTFEDSNIQTMITEISTNISKIINNEISANIEDEISYMLDFKNYVSDLQNFDTLSDEKITQLSNFLNTLSESKIFNNSKKYIEYTVIDKAEQTLIDNGDELSIAPLLENIKTNITNISLKTLIDDITSLKNEADNFKSLDISTMDTTKVSNSLNTMRSTTTFNDNFTNSIVKNLLDKVNNDIQANTLILSDKKEEIANYVNEKKNILDNSSTTINDETYKSILDGLKEKTTL